MNIADSSITYLPYDDYAQSANTLFHYGIKNTSNIDADLYFGSKRYELTLESSDNDQLFFANEAVFFTEMFDKQLEDNCLLFKESGHNKSKLLENNSQNIKDVRNAIESWQVYHFHDTSSTAEVKKFCNIDDNASLRHNASNLAAFLYLLKEKYNKNYKSIINVIQLTAPYFEDFILRPNPLNETKIKLEWKEKNSSEYFDANSLSDGTLRFICLAAVLLQPNLPAAIIIDEPELGLHPFAINLLASLIKRIPDDKQIIISTQSVQLMNEFSVDDIITVDRKDGKSIFKRHNSEDLKEWLDDYTVGELWEKNILGGRP